MRLTLRTFGCGYTASRPQFIRTMNAAMLQQIRTHRKSLTKPSFIEVAMRGSSSSMNTWTSPIMTEQIRLQQTFLFMNKAHAVIIVTYAHCFLELHLMCFDFDATFWAFFCTPCHYRHHESAQYRSDVEHTWPRCFSTRCQSCGMFFYYIDHRTWK